MAKKNLPIQAFVTFFEKNLSQLNQNYFWPAKPSAISRMPGFQWHSVSGNAGEAIELKHYLSSRWAASDETEKQELAEWIVRDWGGVKRNTPETLFSYLQTAMDHQADRPLKGVASYSKILSVADCKEYAIFDARVAACLNAAQLHMESECPIFFHYIPSQNKNFNTSRNPESFPKVFSKRELVDKRGWLEIERNASYTTYLELLHEIKFHFEDTEIYHLEMTLFGIAPSLCKRLVDERA